MLDLAFLDRDLPYIQLCAAKCDPTPLAPTSYCSSKTVIVKYVFRSTSQYEYTLSLESTAVEGLHQKPHPFLTISMLMPDLAHTCEYHAANVLQLCLQCLPPLPALELVSVTEANTQDT
jgi:hypothetical protein